MLVVLSIIGVFAAVSVPSFQHFMNRSNDEVLQGQFLHAIQLAQQEAASGHVPVAICKSNNQISCGGQWEEGQIVFKNDRDDGVIHDKNQILAVMQVSSPHGLVSWRSFPNDQAYLGFSPTGFMQNNNGTFLHCHIDNHLASWAIIISKTGRARVAYPDKNGQITDGRGKAFSC